MGLVNSARTHWYAKKGLKSQILQLLFMNSSRNSEICLLKRVQKKESKTLEMQTWVEIISTQTHTWSSFYSTFLGFLCAIDSLHLLP